MLVLATFTLVTEIRKEAIKTFEATETTKTTKIIKVVETARASTNGKKSEGGKYPKNLA